MGNKGREPTIAGLYIFVTVSRPWHREGAQEEPSGFPELRIHVRETGKKLELTGQSYIQTELWGSEEGPTWVFRAADLCRHGRKLPETRERTT